MRKLWIVFLVLLAAWPLVAQVRTGSIYGKVVDSSGEALPGATVTLTGFLTGAVSFITTEEGIFRFLSLAPAKDYSLKAELQGFKTTTRGNIIIIAGGNVKIILTLEQGALSEEVTVTASNPVVDAKKTLVGVTLSQETLQSLPSARDPFNIMKMAPGAGTYTEDVGGSEGGQAIVPLARGGFSTTLWVMDGMVINDAFYIGCQPTYFDFDSLDEINVTVGGADVTAQSGGIALNLVTRRGGNRISLGGRFYLTDAKFQANNMTQALRDEGLAGTNRINVIRDYGFNLGGPLVKDKAWFFGSYSVQDIQNISRYNMPSKTLLETFLAKLNFQIVPNNRLEFFAEGNRKLKSGTDPDTYNPEGFDRPGLMRFGYPVVRIQDEHMFGDNMFASLKFGYWDGGYIEVPSRDPKGQLLAINDLKQKRGFGGYLTETSPHPAYQAAGSLSYFNDKLFGLSQELKLGFELMYREGTEEYNYPGNLQLERNFVDPTADFTGDGYPDIPTDSNFYGLRLARGVYEYQAVNAWAGYFSDTLTFGRFNAILGIRYDQQSPKVIPGAVLAIDRANNATTSTFTPQTIDLLDSLLPGVQIPEVKGTAADGSLYSWRVWSPRISLNYDITGDGKTLAKVAFSQYGNLMGADEAYRWRPGGYDGFLYFYWQDNGDYKADFSELYWYTLNNYHLYRVFDDAGNFIGNWNDAADTFWGNYDYTNPQKLDKTTYNRIDANAGSPRTTELMFTLEREIFVDAGVQINLVYRKNDRTKLTYKYFPGTNTFIDQSYYISAGTAPASIPGVGDTGKAKDNQWYYRNEQATAYSPYTWTKNNPDYYSDYWGIDLVFNKRLSHKWMLNSSFTYQSSAANWGKTGVLDQTNRWAIDGVNNAMLWMFKIAGLYQLPFDINLSANFIAHQNRRINKTINITDYRLPNPKSRSATLYLDPAGSETLPTMVNMSVRLEKMLKIMETGRIYLMADVFNAFNLTIAESRNNKTLGNYYIYPDPAQNRFVPNITSYQLTKILNPLVARFGVRFQF